MFGVCSLKDKQCKLVQWKQKDPLGYYYNNSGEIMIMVETRGVVVKVEDDKRALFQINLTVA